MAIITVYPGARVSKPVDQADLAWPEIAAELELLANEPPGAPPGASPEEQKKTMVAWGPHALRPGASRGNAGVEAITMLAIDVDAGDPEDAAARLAAAGVAGLVYESPSSTPEAPRFRVVAPLAAPIAPERCRETRLAFAEALGIGPGAGVEACCEPGRLFFIGRMHDTPPRRVWRVDGTPLAEAELPAPTQAWGSAQAPAVAVAPLATLPPGDAGLVAALGPYDAHAGRKWHLCGALGGVMRRMGYAASACEAVVRAWLPAGRADIDVAAGVRHALGAWAKPADAVSGHGALAELLGEEHATVVERAAWAGSFAGRVAATRPPRVTPVTATAPTARPPAGKNFASLADYIRGRSAVAYDVRLLAVVRQADGRRWTDADTAHLRLELSAMGVEASKENLADAVELVAHENEFDPVAVYLESLPPWDGVKRSAFVQFFGAAPGVWADACWRVFSVSAVARALDPGCKVDTMVVLEGEQGHYKSSGLRALAGADFFSDTSFVLDSPKAAIEALMGVWIHEVAELSGLRGRDAERVKAAMSSQVDRARMSYGRFAEAVPRRSVFAATRNPDGSQWLTDTTGNRRYLPLAVGRVDVAAIAANRDQLWAEAVARFKAGEPWWLQRDETPEHEAETEARTEGDPWETPIRAWLAKNAGAKFALAELFDVGGPLPTSPERVNQQLANRAGRLLKRMGIARRQVRVGKERQWLYETGEAPAPRGANVGAFARH